MSTTRNEKIERLINLQELLDLKETRTLMREKVINPNNLSETLDRYDGNLEKAKQHMEMLYNDKGHTHNSSIDQKEKKDIFISQVTGDTLLHLAVESCKNPEELKYFIERFEIDAMNQMIVIVNDDGKIPYQLVAELPLSDEEKIKVYNLLIKILPRVDHKSMSELISFEDIKARYQPKPDTDLYKNLEMACDVVNDIRKKFKLSSTHPQVWGLPQKEVLEIENYKNHLIEETKKCRDLIISNFNNNKETDKTALFNRLLENEEKLFSEAKLANCEQQSYAAAYRFIRDKKIHSKIYFVEDGDHVFNIIGHKKDKVLCDTWSGTVCPVYDMVSKLGTHYSISDLVISDVPVIYNAVTSFNPAYHSIYPLRLFETDDFTKHPHRPLKLAANNNEQRPLFTSIEDELTYEIKKGNLSILFFLFKTTAGRNLLNDARIRNAITKDKLNLISIAELPNIFTQSYHSELPLLIFLLGHEDGCDLIDRHSDLRDKIIPQGLNKIQINGCCKGASSLGFLMYRREGVSLMLKYPELRAKITGPGLNSIETDEEEAGVTPLLYMMKTDLGYQMLQCPDIIEKINVDGLNSICRNGPQSSKSLVSYLCTSTEGIQILLNNPGLTNKIRAEAMFNSIRPDQPSSTWQCPADFIEANSKVFRLFNEDVQRKMIDYIAGKHRQHVSIFSPPIKVPVSLEVGPKQGLVLTK